MKLVLAAKSLPLKAINRTMKRLLIPKNKFLLVFCFGIWGLSFSSTIEAHPGRRAAASAAGGRCTGEAHSRRCLQGWKPDQRGHRKWCARGPCCKGGGAAHYRRCWARACALPWARGFLPGLCLTRGFLPGCLTGCP